MESLGSAILETPLTLCSIASTMSYTPELDYKDLLPKTPHIWVILHREIKLIAIRETYPNWLAFIVIEGSIYNTGEEYKSLMLPSSKPCELQQWPTTLAKCAHWYSSKKISRRK